MDRPTKDQSRDLWNDYATSLGLDAESYSNKESLIEAVDAAEAGNFDSAITREDLDAQAAVNQDTLGESPPPEVTPGVQGKYPEGYEDASEGWKAAYDHAVAHGNPSKTAVVFADINHDKGDFNQESDA